MNAVLIPHAGKPYAGECRLSAFSQIKKPASVKYIIYIATLHYINDTDTIVELYRDKGFPEMRSKKTKKKTTTTGLQTITEDAHHGGKSYTPEHSFEWVHEELQEHFPNAKILAVAPNGGVKARLSRWIGAFVKRHRQTLIIGTTDLIHYGERFGNIGSLGPDIQRSKEQIEQEFISLLTAKQPSIPKIQAFIQKQQRRKPEIACGSKAVIELMKVVKALRLTGVLVDTYDSSRYETNKDSFVSYASIVFS